MSPVTELAAVIMAHRDGAQVRRLIDALDDVPIALHCDAKADRATAAEMVRDGHRRVVALPRTSGALDSWSLVRIELDALRAALASSSAAHIAVLSGADYPLAGMQELCDSLRPWAEKSYLYNAPVPYEPWSMSRHPDGGRWRMARYFATRGDDVVFVGKFPVRFPWPRRIPPGLALRASSQWKVYARADAVRLLATVDKRPELVRFWRHTLVPDESFVSSVLSSPALNGGFTLPDCYGLPWFLRWPRAGAHHPAVLTLDDVRAVAAAREAPPGLPQLLANPDCPAPQALFARKVASAESAALLDVFDDWRAAGHSISGSPDAEPLQ